MAYPIDPPTKKVTVTPMNNEIIPGTPVLRNSDKFAPIAVATIVKSRNIAPPNSAIPEKKE